MVSHMPDHSGEDVTPRRAFTVTEVADQLGVSVSHVRRLVEAGTIRKVPHMGRRVLIAAGELDRLLGDAA